MVQCMMKCIFLKIVLISQATITPLHILYNTYVEAAIGRTGELLHGGGSGLQQVGWKHQSQGES